ncbi:sulfur oxidation c-type cytochrome SoxX [Spongiibacter sp. KMU-158]|uniref:Sulfur oxidation c-type cytochrome SoxX n=1 Tax=Spongiibacter pelagi TaxID=2760804 RepID=A0A927C5D8_9GAMM|nr:sulfur oxidation c-type cytochrome SoxX [Spongiibacter pelagi]MBD2860232.1 sulfur oxidation c-type cytochrome SoxX [Spongiibacter pelagi]
MKNAYFKLAVPLLISIALAACAKSPEPNSANKSNEPKSAEQIWRSSMKAKNHVGLDRITQTELQKACSNNSDIVANEAQRAVLQQQAMNSVAFPADGNYLGDWQRGEAIAGDGKGLQWNDNPNEPNGGNCYACHELSPKEVAYGTIGPSLKNYGMRGQSEAMLQYTWAKIWNPNAYTLCSHMPRFGDAGILTEQQLKDVMAYLLDPASPVNK